MQGIKQLIGIFLGFSGFLFPVFAQEVSINKARVTFIKQQVVMEVEIAKTEQARQYGLMNRTQLDSNSGMLFVYSDEALRGVWMKNTLLPLDVLFINRDGRIVSIAQNLQPCKIERCPVTDSQGIAQYMLEVNAGFIDRHNIQLGQTVLMDYQHEKQ